MILPARADERTRGKPRVALFSPFPPLRSGIADYAVTLVESLLEYYSIELYHDGGYTPDLGFPLLSYDHRLFPRRNRVLSYHAVVYQMGNSAYHRFVYESLLRHPGIVTLHDFFLGGFHAEYGSWLGDVRNHLCRELRRERARLDWESAVETDPDHYDRMFSTFRAAGIWFNRRVFEQARGVILHDDYCRKLTEASMPDLAEKATVVPFGTSERLLSGPQRQEIRRRLGLPPEAHLVGCFGIIHPTKCNREIIDAFAALAAVLPSALLLVVGQEYDRGETRARVAELKLDNQVRFFNHCSLADFEDLIAVADIGINLRRPPTNGETSASLFRLLGSGVPTIVTDVGTFAGLPDEVVVKVPPDDGLLPALAKELLSLAQDADRRDRIHTAALAYIRGRHVWARVAAGYVSLIERTRDRNAA
jgi:glycosyltransferase involved in cell wall biosynthesis